MEVKLLYRYEIDYSNHNWPTKIELLRYPVVRETEKSYFIDVFRYKPKRVSKTSSKAYAFSTKEAALARFEARIAKRISWYEYWLSECRKAQSLLKKGEYEK